MAIRALTHVVLLSAGVVLAGCAAGPGHTRAAGAGFGTAAGALFGAAVAGPGHRGTGAALGGLLGYAVGSDVGEGIAQDQERCCPPRHRVIRRRVLRPRQVTVYDEVIEEEVVPCDR